MNATPDYAWVGLSIGLLVVLPTVILIAASIVALFVARNKVIRTIAAVVLVTIGILVFGAILIVPAVTLTRGNVPQSVQDTAAYSSAPLEGTWDASTEEALRASIYSSAESAARALTQSCLDAFQANLSEPPAEVKIYVGPQAQQHAPALAAQMSSFLSERFPISKVSDQSGPAPDPLPEEPLCISVELIDVGVSPRAPWDSSSRYTQGQIRFKGNYQGKGYQNLRRFVEKPWVDHFDDFVSQRPGRRLMRANSDRFSISERESDRSAREQAARLMSPILEQSYGVPRGRALDLAVESALDDGEVIVDRFSQQLSSQSGDVWRTTLLIDARPETLSKIVHQPGSNVRRYENRRRSAWIGISVVLALAVFLYFVLDELTKGYFAWNLRVTALLTMLTLAVVFCWWMNAMT